MIFKIDKTHVFKTQTFSSKKKNRLENIDALEVKCNKRNSWNLHFGIFTGIV